VSKKQQAGTRKVVGAIASVTPVGKAVGAAKKISKVASHNRGQRAFGKYKTKEWAKEDRLAGVGAPKQPNYPSNLKSVKNKPSKTVGLETRGKRISSQETLKRAQERLTKKGIRGKKFDPTVVKIVHRQRTGDAYDIPSRRGTSDFYQREMSRAQLLGSKKAGTVKGIKKTTKVLSASEKRALKAANKKK
jgi:hypothetical protein